MPDSPIDDAIVAKLNTIEPDAREWVRELNAAATRDKEADGGWPDSQPADDRPDSPRAHARFKRSLARVEPTNYSELVLAEVENFRNALTRRDMTAAMGHALTAIHHHGAAQAFMTLWRERAEEAASGGRALKRDVSNELIVSLFEAHRSNGLGRDKACAEVVADLAKNGQYISAEAVKDRLKTLGRWR